MTTIHDQCGAIGNQIRELRHELNNSKDAETKEYIESQIALLEDARNTLRGIGAFYKIMSEIKP